MVDYVPRSELTCMLHVRRRVSTFSWMACGASAYLSIRHMQLQAVGKLASRRGGLEQSTGTARFIWWVLVWATWIKSEFHVPSLLAKVRCFRAEAQALRWLPGATLCV